MAIVFHITPFHITCRALNTQDNSKSLHQAPANHTKLQNIQELVCLAMEFANLN